MLALCNPLHGLVERPELLVAVDLLDLVSLLGVHLEHDDQRPQVACLQGDALREVGACLLDLHSAAKGSGQSQFKRTRHVPQASYFYTREVGHKSRRNRRTCWRAPRNVAVKAYVGGGSATNDLRATGDREGTIIHLGGSNDIIRDGRFNDILDGGRGSDQMYGGGGADQFRFFGNQIEGASDRDRIYDLNFGAGDTLVLSNYSPQTFRDASVVNAYGGGSNAIIKSWDGGGAISRATGTVTRG